MFFPLFSPSQSPGVTRLLCLGNQEEEPPWVVPTPVLRSDDPQWKRAVNVKPYLNPNLPARLGLETVVSAGARDLSIPGDRVRQYQASTFILIV